MDLVKRAFAVSCSCFGSKMGGQNQAAAAQATVGVGQESNSYWAPAETFAEASAELVEPWPPSWIGYRPTANERPRLGMETATEVLRKLPSERVKGSRALGDMIAVVQTEADSLPSLSKFRDRRPSEVFDRLE